MLPLALIRKTAEGRLKMGFKFLVVVLLMHSSFNSVFSMPQNSKSSISEENNLDGIETASKLKAFVEILDKYFTSGMNKEMTARWGYITNITDENEIIQVMRCPASSYPLLINSPRKYAIIRKLNITAFSY